MAAAHLKRRVEVKVDRLSKVIGAITDLVGQEVLVGIPSTVSHRESEAVTNAQLGYIHEFGAPASNVPGRPFLIPGIRDAEATIAAQLKLAVNDALSGKSATAIGHLNRAGIAAASAAKERIRSNIPPPLSPSTIRGRKYARGSQSRRAGEKEYLELISQGMAASAAQSAAGLVALINTGQLMRSITWVVRRAVR